MIKRSFERAASLAAGEGTRQSHRECVEEENKNVCLRYVHIR